MTDLQTQHLAERLGASLKRRGWRVAAAESCTGGRIASAITAVAGSSAWFECGVVSYANSVKHQLLGVQSTSLEQFGAVSNQVVCEMVSGVQQLSSAEVAVAVSGIAGPSGGSTDKPVGTVWFAWATPSKVFSSCHVIPGDRNAVQSSATLIALQGLLELLDSE